MRLPNIAVLAVLAATLGGVSCSFGESGVAPPLDQLFLPGASAVDPDGRWMYVVNSNSDLRFNAGTLAAVDLQAAAADRNRQWPRCPSPGFVNSSKADANYCCRDFFDNDVLNCDERAYIDPASTVQLGSFGSTLIVGGGPPGAPATTRRLYLSVRAEPSVTFVDVDTAGGSPTMRCAEGTPGRNHLCDDSHKVRGETDISRGPPLAEEPQNLVLDEKLRLLYVSHAAAAVSVIDLCPDKPTLVSVRAPVFELTDQWVTSLAVSEPGNPGGEIFATGRNYFISGAIESAQIRSLYLRGAESPCQGDPRSITLVPGDGFFSSAFYSFGSDIRSILLANGKRRAFVLHRNAIGRENPAALVAIDRALDASGQPLNMATSVLEICAGATEMSWHDAGRGPRLHVVCFEAGQVYVVEPDSLTINAIINTGRGPNDLTFSDKDPHLAYVTGFSDNNVSVIDLKPGSRTEYKVVQRIGFPHAGPR